MAGHRRRRRGVAGRAQDERGRRELGRRHHSGSDRGSPVSRQRRGRSSTSSSESSSSCARQLLAETDHRRRRRRTQGRKRRRASVDADGPFDGRKVDVSGGRKRRRCDVRPRRRPRAPSPIYEPKHQPPGEVFDLQALCRYIHGLIRCTPCSCSCGPAADLKPPEQAVVLTAAREEGREAVKADANVEKAAASGLEAGSDDEYSSDSEIE